VIGLIEHTDKQGSEGWLESRRGVITGSRAKDARDFKKNGESSDKRDGYARDVARERVGGKVPDVYQNSAMRTGHEEEPFAAIAYFAETGIEVEEVGFITTEDRKFGCSLDRRVVGANAAIEIKTMVSSATLFKAVVERDISEYRDQCLFALWMLSLDWIDLCLWSPDLPKQLHIVHIARDENEIQRFEDDMVAFERLVGQYEVKLLDAMAGSGAEPAATLPWEDLPGQPSQPVAAAATPAPRPTAPRAAAPVALPDFF
jgi:exodeoxyribonuclease (lambda-induced)